MTTNFTNNGADIDQLYITDYALIDRYVTTGSLWGWGINNSGNFADNTSVPKSSPVQTVSGGTNWVYASAGVRNGSGIKADGTLWIWGDNGYGQLGDNSIVKKSSPVQTVSGGTNWKQQTHGHDYTIAIKTDGTLWGWGYNVNGGLGDGSLVSKSSPVQTVAGGNSWKQAVAAYQTTWAIKIDGTLWAWGQNTNGQIGDNTRTTRSSPVQTVAGGSNWYRLSSNPGATSQAQTINAIKTDGTLWTWGQGLYWSLGDGTNLAKSSPVQTSAGGTNWRQCSVGTQHCAGIKTDGTLWMWGTNSQGQLGTNDVTTYSTPVQTISGGTNWKMISCGSGTSYHYSGGIKTDGTLWMWGHNAPYGDLGNNAINTLFSSPIQTVAGGTNWKSITCSNNFNLAIYFYDAYNLYPK